MYSARIFLFLIVISVLTAGSTRAQSAGQSVTIIVAERHAFSLSLAPKGATAGTVTGPTAPALANQGTNRAPSYTFESSREAKKITAILLSAHGRARALLSMTPPERGFGTGLQSLGSEAQDLVVGYFPPGQPPLGLEYRALAGASRSVLTLTITD